VPLKLATEIAIHAPAREAPDRPAWVGGDETLSYGDLSERVRRVASALRGRLQPGQRVAIACEGPAEAVVAAFGALEASLLTWMPEGRATPELLAAFAPDLVVGEGGLGHPRVSVAELLADPQERSPGRPDFRRPVLALPRPDGAGEVLHNHKTLAATAVAVSSFYMIDSETRVLFLEPPSRWHSLALLLGTWKGGGAAIAGFGEPPAPFPDRVDYLVASWELASRHGLDLPTLGTSTKIGAGAILAIEGPFSLSRRRRIARRFRTPILTLFGRNDLGPALGSHPTWFLDDAVGIPLPNVDTRPLNPSDGSPLSIGWDAVEEAELGIKSALAPAGGDLVAEGWLRTRLLASVDPTGLYFFRTERGGLG
jgi:hypothetical protein